ncbi:hypothetical protein DENIS_3488 [Desulfonema ishimotonii]|uniref:Uncharacterized protein n=1 Tax=Desulfonema ishimotonii TaxID=45657 RepID=A0A401FZZ9_9BACT|nr:hypothetical protein [Desulfonema ishimotonii]GBC62516.1 hypothetical protein DENIS_3488 [Desulfonema ishimotonii]
MKGLAHIRRKYGVDAYHRRPVRLHGRPGIITGAWAGEAVTVRLDGDSHSIIVRPDQPEYLSTPIGGKHR